ncbi:winged helix-turn-helix transcriptional regulator [Nonomuraea sp. NPDC001699]
MPFEHESPGRHRLGGHPQVGKRFSDIAAAVPGMTDKLLSQRLKDLEADGLVERVVQATTPVRVDYRLTEKGAALGTVLLDLNRWALDWITLPTNP